MQLAHMFLMLVGVSLLGLAGYCCLSLLKTAQCREDAEDEKLWHYLLDPRSI
jgi:Tfp pilus assembly protein PilV